MGSKQLNIYPLRGFQYQFTRVYNSKHDFQLKKSPFSIWPLQLHYHCYTASSSRARERKKTPEIRKQRRKREREREKTGSRRVAQIAYLAVLHSDAFVISSAAILKLSLAWKQQRSATIVRIVNLFIIPARYWKAERGSLIKIRFRSTFPARD